MFVALNTVQERKGRHSGKRLSGIWRIFHKTRLSIREARAGDVKYFIIDVPVKNGRIPWDKVYNAAGREASRLIIPEGIVPPAGSHIKPYDPSAFLKHVFYNTVFSILKRLNISPGRLVIGLYDPYAKAAPAALELLKYCRHLKVVTASPEKYDKYCERAMAEYGAGMIVSDMCEAFESCGIIVAPDGCAGCRYYPHNALVFDIDGISGYTVTKECIRLPKMYTLSMPTRISEAVFAAALYERARVRQIGSILPLFMVNNGRKISIYDILCSIPEDLGKSDIKFIS